jgi:hypothetical protein
MRVVKNEYQVLQEKSESEHPQMQMGRMALK